jgi:hypothetical protein
MSEQVTLFHGTSSNFLRKIMKHGLLPRNKTGTSIYSGKLESAVDRIYLSDVYAVQFGCIAIERISGNLMIAGVNIDVADLDPDTDFMDGGEHRLRFDNGAACLKVTGCASTLKNVMPYRLWVVPKKICDELKDCSMRIETGFRHKAFYKQHLDQLNYALMMSRRYSFKNGEWSDDRW